MANYALNQYSAPATEPITLAEAKEHLRVVVSDDDQMIARLIAAARSAAETETDRQLVTATWDMYLTDWPSGLEPIYLPKGKLQSVTSITYLDSDGATQTLASSQYRVGTYREPAEITLAYDCEWPSLRGARDQITIRFVCGYGTYTAVPQLLKQAMLLLIGEMYERREDSISGTTIAALPRAARDTFQMFRLGDEFHAYSGVL